MFSNFYSLKKLQNKVLIPYKNNLSWKVFIKNNSLNWKKILFYQQLKRNDYLPIYCIVCNISRNLIKLRINLQKQFVIIFLEKQDKFYLYLGGGLIGGLLSIICVVAAKFVWQRSRRHLDNKHKSENTNHDTSIDPNAFGDNISEVDADIDLTDITQFPITVIPTQQLPPSEVRADIIL